MRTIPILLLITALSAGCATGPSFNRMLGDPSGANARADSVAVAPEEGASRDAPPDIAKTTVSAKVSAANHPTGRLIKCTAIRAVFGLVVIPVFVAKTLLVSGNPPAHSGFDRHWRSSTPKFVQRVANHEIC